MGNIALLRSAALLRAFAKSIESRGKTMSKEQKSNKETKKQPAMTAKEKKAAKKAKKNEKSRIGE